MDISFTNWSTLRMFFLQFLSPIFHLTEPQMHLIEHTFQYVLGEHTPGPPSLDCVTLEQCWAAGHTPIY